MADCNDGGGLAGQEFKDLLRDARLAKGTRERDDVRPADVARALGITRSAYGHWESGRSRPKDVATVEKLAAFLEVSVGDLGIDLRSLPPVFEKPAKFKREAKRTFQPHAKKRRKGNDRT